MPIYEYRCRTCDEVFESLRSSTEADAAARCSRGHDDAVRVLSVVARPARGDAAPAASGGGGGACCAAGCACGRN